MNNKVFVYGTLRTNQNNYDVIAPFIHTTTTAQIRGWMYDLGEYPTVVEGSGFIHGEVFELNDAELAFERLDELEAYFGPNNLKNEYERMDITAITENGQSIPCQVYFFSNSRKEEISNQYSLIESGNWLKKKEKQHHLYFAYGSCMNSQSFSKDVPEFHMVGKALLQGFRVGFTKFSTKWQGGVADILPVPNQHVEGMLYLIPHRMLEPLDRRENASISNPNPRYRRTQIWIDIDDIKLKAYTYEIIEKEKNEIAPTSLYMETILFETHMLSPHYVQKLTNHMTQLLKINDKK